MTETTADLVTGPGESASLEAMGYKQELKRALSFWDLIVFGLIVIVADGAVPPCSGSSSTAHNGMAPLAYVGRARSRWRSRRCSYMTMSRAFPVAGSAYAYRRSRHRRVGGLHSGLGDPARLSAGAGALLCRLPASAHPRAWSPEVRALVTRDFWPWSPRPTCSGIEAATRIQHGACCGSSSPSLLGFVVLGGLALLPRRGGRALCRPTPIWQPASW